MKFYSLLLLAVIALAQVLKGQSAISEKDIARVLGVLTADSLQGRASFSPGIEKAARFLAAEFKQIGLQPLPGASNYLQTFAVYNYKLLTAQVSIEGDTIPAENIVAASSRKVIDWHTGQPNGPKLERISATDDARKRINEIFSQQADALILLDTSYRMLLPRLRQALGGRNISLQDGAMPTRVFVLTTATTTGGSYSVKLQSAAEQLSLTNVVGVLPGTSRKQEQVLFSAHYDHLGIIQPLEEDSIANGADDDASGTTAVVELARYYAKKGPQPRTLMFVAFTAEEIGGYGSRYYSQQMNPDQVVAMFNLEMLGKPSKFGPNTAFITGYERSDFGKLLQANLQGSKFRFEPDPYPEQNLFYRSDNAALARVGVPAHTISTDQIDIDKLYHTVKDELTSLDLANMTEVIRAIAQAATGIVSGRQTPTRIPPASVH